jgi:hypothetical protein
MVLYCSISEVQQTWKGKKTHKNHIQVKKHVCIMLFVSIGRGDKIELSRILDK